MTLKAAPEITPLSAPPERKPIFRMFETASTRAFSGPFPANTKGISFNASAALSSVAIPFSVENRPKYST